MVKVYSPASAANISVGFDILGAAITPIDGTLLGDCVSVEFADSFHLVNQGKFVSSLPPCAEDNIVYQCWVRFCEVIGKTVPVTMTLEKNMPIGSGLGSSACSVVAALVAMNELLDRPLNDMQMLTLMGELEGRISGSVHYDNVAPCYLGGMQLILEEGGVISQALPHFDDWYWVMAYPGIVVSTAAARAILPETYSRKECVAHGRHTAGFVHACYSRQPALAATFLQDVIAEPYRKQLLPNFTHVCDGVKSLGGLASGISGSGPTLFAIADSLAIAKKIENWLRSDYLQNDAGFVHICRIDTAGTRKLD